MTTPTAKPLLTARLLDRWHRSDLPGRTLLAGSFALAFAGFAHQGAGLFAAALAAAVAAPLVLLVLGAAYLGLFVVAGLGLTLAEAAAGAWRAHRRRYT